MWQKLYSDFNKAKILIKTKAKKSYFILSIISPKKIKIGPNVIFSFFGGIFGQKIHYIDFGTKVIEIINLKKYIFQ